MVDADRASDWTPPTRGGRWSEAVGRAMVESFRRSGDSQGAFARRHGMNAQRVKYWVDRVEGRRAHVAARRARQSAQVSFAPVRVVDAANTARALAAPPIEVVVGAAVVRVPSEFDEAHLRRVVAALGGGSC